MTFSVATAQKVIKEYEKDENQGINVLDNSPPTDPVITCPDTVRKNRMFRAKAVSTDPDGNQIYYRFKLGETGTPTPWGGPYPSGVQYQVDIKVEGYAGTLPIIFQAKDEHDAESGWSYHTITFTKAKSKPIISPVLNFLQQHPHLFPLLRLLLKL